MLLHKGTQLTIAGPAQFNYDRECRLTMKEKPQQIKLTNFDCKT